MSDQNGPLVSLITVNFNQPELTAALLDSIRRQDYPHVQTLVVDNGSREPLAPVLESDYPEVTFITSAKNLGFAGGNNLALPAANGKYLFFVNNDAELTSGCIRKLLALFDTVPGMGMASPMICFYPKPGQEVDLIQYAGMTPVHPLTARNRTLGAHEPNRGQFAESYPSAYAHGAAMMIRREVLDQAGPMEQRFFLYYEELDWCERIRREGFSIWVEPRALVYHKESSTVGKLSPLKTYFLNRNRIYFMRRNFSGVKIFLFCLFLVFITIPKNLIVFGIKRDWARAKAFWQAMIWHIGFKKNEFEKLS